MDQYPGALVLHTQQTGITGHRVEQLLDAPPSRVEDPGYSAFRLMRACAWAMSRWVRPLPLAGRELIFQLAYSPRFNRTVCEELSTTRHLSIESAQVLENLGLARRVHVTTAAALLPTTTIDVLRAYADAITDGADAAALLEGRLPRDMPLFFTLRLWVMGAEEEDIARIFDLDEERRARLRGIRRGTETPPQVRPQLTEREREIIGALARGMDRTEMARTMFLFVNTVKTQLSSAYRKLGASNRQEALEEAARRGYVRASMCPPPLVKFCTERPRALLSRGLSHVEDRVIVEPASRTAQRER